MSIITYGCEITPNKIIWYIDGLEVRTIMNPGCHEAFWVELSLVLDPNYPPSAFGSFDVVMDVDYFRFYELNQDCAQIASSPHFMVCNNINDPTLNTDVKKVINVNCVQAQTLPPGVHNWRATDYIQINGDFYVPVGRELYLDVNTCY